MNVRTGTDRLHVSYWVHRPGGREKVQWTVRIVRVPCRFGGTRTYFLCPGEGCGRRVLKLYQTGKAFRCRSCCGLAYASQSEGVRDRALRRLDKIRRRLGGEPGTAFPPRPKGMWRKRYERLKEEAFEAERLADEEFLAAASRVVRQIEKKESTRRFWP